MDLFSVKTIKNILQTQGIKPQKRLGQNFLTARGVLGDILKAAGLKKSDTVLEIGPGIGTLTRALALAAKRVVAVEKDSAMVEILNKTTKDLTNVEIIHADILSFPKPGLGKTLGKTYKVVANLPYYITSPVIRMFLEAENKPDLLILMVQKEVAQRICARPTSPGRSPGGRARPPKMSLLAVSVQVYGKPSIVSYVKKSCFWPRPKVDSAILKIMPYTLTELRYPHLNQAKFFEVVRAGFKQPRKQLGNNLAQGLKLSRQEVEMRLRRIGIAPTQRAETLSIQDWIKLAKDYTIDK